MIETQNRKAAELDTPVWDVFIAYTRPDVAFVKQLADGLRGAGKTVWVDLEGLYVGEQWWESIKKAIEAASVFLFVVSNHVVRTAVCCREAEHAAAVNKRILPVLKNEPGRRDLPDIISKTHLFRALETSEDFDSSLKDLVHELGSDPTWMRAHTRWLQRALDWDRNGRAGQLLLRGAHFAEAEDWLAKPLPTFAPAVSAVQREYILASRQANFVERARELLATPGRELDGLSAATQAAELSESAGLELPPAAAAVVFQSTQRVLRSLPLRAHDAPIRTLI